MNSSTPPSPSPAVDTPVEVRGYITDPKFVGYQILTNYESTYWAPLVGNDAWRLYEVLRSFCHHGNDTCYPSINFLLTILGLKDRSVLIGRAKPKEVKGKAYHYPGLIQILQDQNLIVAEVTGEGPLLRYIFHVNLTPDLLTAHQLAQLPTLLQDKHAELIQKCEEEKRKLEAKKRPPKLLPESKPVATVNPKEGVLEIPRGDIGNSKRGYWKFQYKQQPINNTQLTTGPRVDHNNNSSGLHASPDEVVVALTQQGIAEKVAKRLAGHYSPQRIAEKIEFLVFLQKNNPDMVKNPRGWLRKAIEEDYGVPDGFITQTEQARLDAQAAQQAQQAAAAARQREAFAAHWQAQQEAYDRQLRDHYGTTAADEQLWTEVLSLFKASRPDLHDVYAQARLLNCTDEAVLLGFECAEAMRPLEHPGTMAALKRQLKILTKQPLDVKTVLLPATTCATRSVTSTEQP